jgi:hypothetical protein
MGFQKEERILKVGPKRLSMELWKELEATLDLASEGRADGSAEGPADGVPVGADEIEG